MEKITMSQDVEVIQVIKTRLLRLGTGQEQDPVRIITQYWDMNGNLLWQTDPERITLSPWKQTGI